MTLGNRLVGNKPNQFAIHANNWKLAVIMSEHALHSFFDRLVNCDTFEFSTLYH